VPPEKEEKKRKQISMGVRYIHPCISNTVHQSIHVGWGKHLARKSREGEMHGCCLVGLLSERSHEIYEGQKRTRDRGDELGNKKAIQDLSESEGGIGR
jgi:hypothetical protein